MQTEFQARVRTTFPLHQDAIESVKLRSAILTCHTLQFNAKQARREAAKAQKADADLQKQIQTVSDTTFQTMRCARATPTKIDTDNATGAL